VSGVGIGSRLNQMRCIARGNGRVVREIDMRMELSESKQIRPDGG
jgi:hypothetical protein